MDFHRADLMSEILFSLFSFLMFLGTLKVFRSVHISKNIQAIWAAYIVFFSGVVLIGIVASFPFAFAPMMLLSVLICYSFLAFSSIGFKVGQHYSFALLVGFQIFRIPLELLLHHWANINTIPETMTWTGQNWDILSGIAALIIFPIANRFKNAVWVFQILGFVLLINVLRVVVMSSPLPFAWPLVNPLQLVMYFPYALIAPLFVGSALFGHLVLFRKLIYSS